MRTARPVALPWRDVMPACFGVVCPLHGRCARYAAVEHSTADADTRVTCQTEDRMFPLFLAMPPVPGTEAELWPPAAPA